MPLITHRRKQHDLADRSPPGQRHHQPIDPDPDAAGRRHPVLERLNEGLVVGLRLVIAGAGQCPLLLEPAALLVGIVELGERVGELDAADVRLEALDQALDGPMPFGERRQLDRVVEQERWFNQRRFDVLCEQLVDELFREIDAWIALGMPRPERSGGMRVIGVVGA